ncbi:MAG: hypothetical protein LBQ84_06650 [Flavobacteriaceae bacterium]|jgi:predicted transcriptional regulator|nr:hypothetical protein [Flavobacteriaceae bacterium]
MIQELIKSKTILMSLPELINESHFKMSYISEKAGIPKPTFYRKLKDRSFNVDEALKILQIIKPEEYEYETVMANIKESEKDFEEGKVIEGKDFIFDVKQRLKK